MQMPNIFGTLRKFITSGCPVASPLMKIFSEMPTMLKKAGKKQKRDVISV